MKEQLLTLLIATAIPALISLAFTGAFALLGVWKRANEAAKTSAFNLAFAQLESGVEAALHDFQGQATTLAAQYVNGKMTAQVLATALLTSLKKEGRQYIVPAIGDALNKSMSELETSALAMAAKKVGLSPAAAPYVIAGPGALPVPRPLP